jgi:hypothetical protein
MALNTALVFTQNINGIEGLITDATTNYGLDGNPARNELANFLLFSKNDVDNLRSYYEVDNSSPLTAIEWVVPTHVSGWAQATLLMISLYNPITAYTGEVLDAGGLIVIPGSIVYFTDGRVYKCIQDCIDVAPDNINAALYWIEITDLTTLYGYPNVVEYHQDLMLDYKINKCVTKGFIGMHKCDTLQEMEQAIKNWSLYMSGVANYHNGAPEEMERIFVELDKICTTC